MRVQVYYIIIIIIIELEQFKGEQIRPIIKIILIIIMAQRAAPLH